MFETPSIPILTECHTLALPDIIVSFKLKSCTLEQTVHLVLMILCFFEAKTC